METLGRGRRIPGGGEVEKDDKVEERAVGDKWMQETQEVDG